MTSDPRPLHRIAKLLARAGVASRREIERMIAEGRVALDGVPLDTPATLLASLRGVTVDGVAVEAPAAARLFVFHKPPGLLVTERDPAGRPTIYDRLPADLPRAVPVGRLDLATEGLLLLTTDGGLKRTLELPATGVERAYRARAYGDITQAQLEELIHGVEIEGVRYGQIDANLERRTGANVWIELILTEGKNREVRRVLEYLGLQVSRLIRTRYGPFVLGDLPVGAVGEVRQHDLVAFTKSLKDGRHSDARVEPVAPRTAARKVRQPDAAEPASRPAREPDAPRRAVAAPERRGIAERPRPVGDGDPSPGAAPRPGFRAPPSAGGRSDRAVRFAAATGRSPRARETDDDAPRPAGARARRPADPRRAASPRVRDTAEESRPGRTGPRAARPAGAARPGERQGEAGGWADRPTPGDRGDRGRGGRTTRPPSGDRPTRARAGDAARPKSSGGADRGRTGDAARPADRTKPGSHSPRGGGSDGPRPGGPRRPGTSNPKGKR